ncbi:MAG: BamA/TamA family outer membrane protein [Caldimonas sp.]
MRWPWRVAALAGMAMALGGCASVPFFGNQDDAAAATAKTDAADEQKIALYEFDVEAPSPLRQLLLDFLDLARFQKAPKSDAISGPELDRLVAAAPAQAKALLETEGYFDAEVTVAQTLGASGTPRIVLSAVPGPRVTIDKVTIDATTPLAARTPTRQDSRTDHLQRMREDWSLGVGQPFRQSAWSSAKTAALGELRASGYPKADWQSTKARIDATAETAALDLTVAGGDLYRLGAIRVEGIQRYDEAAVRRMATFLPGDVYTEKALLDYQERLLKVGLFEGASVEIDVEKGPPDAAPVIVKLKELSQQQATFGVGYSANTGPRFSVDHYDRKVFGWPYIAHSTVVFGPSLKSIGTELNSYPLENLKRNLFAVNLEQLKAADETRDFATVRAGRSQDTGDYSRLYYGELSRTQVANTMLRTTSVAAAGHYHWLRRDVDNVLLPTSGTVLALQGGAGYGTGTQTRTDRPGEEERAKGPFLRTYARITAFRPLGGWFLNGRLEAGEVFVANSISVPDTLLFRAGGDNSVRGYGYRTLGPSVNGAVVGGRVTLTGSVEAEHPILRSLPALLGAVFVDAGDAADKWGEIKPVFGYGVGVHFRSPVGLLRLDVAYGQAVKQIRLHLSVGVAF